MLTAPSEIEGFVEAGQAAFNPQSSDGLLIAMCTGNTCCHHSLPALATNTRCQHPLPTPAANTRCQHSLPTIAANSRCQHTTPTVAISTRCQQLLTTLVASSCCQQSLPAIAAHAAVVWLWQDWPNPILVWLTQAVSSRSRCLTSMRHAATSANAWRALEQRTYSVGHSLFPVACRL